MHAAQIAMNYFIDLVGKQRPGNLVLEEIELTDDRKTWNVTLSMPRANPTLIRTRDDKILNIDAETGEVRSMKIRSMAFAAD